MKIRSFEARDLDGVVRLSLRAWAPVFVSIEAEMEPEVYRYFFPDWRQDQENAVKAVCTDPEANVWVSETDGVVSGFVAVYQRPSYGEIYMIAVDPDFQKRQIGQALTGHAEAWMREQGIRVAMVETGGDSGHAPARKLYEQQGFRIWPVARYFKGLW